MKKILSIFKRDMKAIIKNPVAILIIGGLCIIPSLYAWVNIKACWNPYENTSTVPIAVVNNDKGATFDNKNIDIGKDVVSELKNNKAIGWTFVDSKKAELGILNGDYYAVIEIPEDFSKDLTSLATDKPVKPEIIYKVDTKSNPVAGKITEVAEEQLVDQIKSNFVATVNQTIFSSLNNVGKSLEANKDQIIGLKDAIIKIDKNMDLIISTLNSTNGNAKNLNTYLNSIKSTIPELTKGIDAIQDGATQSKKLTTYTKNAINNSFDSLDINMDQISASNKKINSLINSLNDSILSGSKDGVSTTISALKQEIDYTSNNIDNVIKFLKELNKKSNNPNLESIITSLDSLKTSLNNEKDKLNSLESSFNSQGELSSGIVKDITSINSSMSNKLKNTLSEYNSSSKESINKICNSYIDATNEANKLLDGSKKLAGSIEGILNSGIDATNLTSDISNDLIKKFNYFKGNISELSKNLQAIKDNNLSEIVTILQSKPEIMGSYISSPFNVKDESIYKIANYGSGMAPIYSVLASWVGCLVLTSLLSTEIKPFEGSENLTIRDKYLGKLVTFVFLAVIQGFIIALGDKFILGVQTVNTPLFILFGVLSSFSFCIIVYTLVSLFRNVGKALAIIYMVIQIAGSGGSYPIQVDPKFFRVLQPLFPFTYALGGYREAIAGPLISSVVLDIVMLLLFAGIFFVIGTFFKEKIWKYVKKFEDKFEESRIAE